MRNIKILFFIGASHMAGAEITNLSLLSDLKNKGYLIHVIVSGWNNGHFISNLEILNIPHSEIKLGFIYPKKPLWTIDTLWNYPKSFYNIRKLLKSFEPNWIFHSSYRSLIMAFPLVFKFKNIYREHDEPDKRWSNKKIYPFLNKNCEAIICPSRDMKRRLLELKISKEKVHIVPSPLDNQLLDIAAKSTKKNNSTTQIGMIGQVIPRKGFDFIWDILKLIELPFTLNIYGDDKTIYAQKLKQTLPTSLREKVKWHGFVKKREQIYDNLDFVIFPSISESFGRIIIEAAAFKIPAIASNLECFKDNIIDQKTGLIFDLEMKSQLKLEIEKLISNSELRHTLGLNAHQMAIEKFSSEICTKKFIKIIS